MNSLQTAARSGKISLREAAIVAGLAYLIILVAAIFANFVVLSRLIVPGDAAATANNIAANGLLFRTAITSFLIVLALDVVVAFALYVLLKPVNKDLSLLAAFFRLTYSAVMGLNLLNLVFALQLSSGVDHLTVFKTDQLQALSLLFLDSFNYGFQIALVFFGVHLFVLGYLVYKSSYIPRTLGILLTVASLGYLINGLAKVLLPNYASYETILLLAIPLLTVPGELFFLVWLLLRGRKIPDMQS